MFTQITKILKDCFSNSEALLLSGNLHEVESLLASSLVEIHALFMGSLLNKVGQSEALLFRLRALGQKLGLGKLRHREVSLQLSTGSEIRYVSWYADQAIKSYEGPRHLSQLYWSCTHKASPLYVSRVSLLSVLCPSYEVAESVLSHFQLSGSDSRIRKLSMAVGKYIQSKGPSSLLKKGENLSGKRVVIMCDGGRSRTRSYSETCEGLDVQSEEKSAKYETPWVEPRLLVIQVLDEDGKVLKKEELPIYWADIEAADGHFHNLEKLLVALDVPAAKEVQFVGDGAKWIWKRIRTTLIKVGIDPKKITLTLDYYHAAQHLHLLVKKLAGNKEEKKSLLKKLKDNLWNGLISSLTINVQQYMREKQQALSKHTINKLKYFQTHYDHMQYAKFRKNKWLCGSGIVESAIRRVINLRFKSASSFWLKENLELLIPLRCALLAGRWKMLIRSFSSN